MLSERVVYRGGLTTRRWSFYILSGGGTDKLAGIGLKTEFGE